jgi:hypothetical protein
MPSKTLVAKAKEIRERDRLAEGAKRKFLREFRRLLRRCDVPELGRDFFRANSKYGDGWTVYWPTFKAFREAYYAAASEAERDERWDRELKTAVASAKDAKFLRERVQDELLLEKCDDTIAEARELRSKFAAERLEAARREAAGQPGGQFSKVKTKGDGNGRT